jgi:hypothetical protein
MRLRHSLSLVQVRAGAARSIALYRVAAGSLFVIGLRAYFQFHICFAVLA